MDQGGTRGRPQSAWRRAAERLGPARFFIMVFAPLVVLVAVVLLLIARTIDPAPPRHVRMATGTPGGAYAATGEALRAQLAAEGVELELVPTSGSVENLELLDRADGGADVAIIQGGVGIDRVEAGGLESLGALFYEPLWLFTTRGAGVDDVRALRGRRVAVGPVGSGVRALAELLFAENGLTADDVRESDQTGEAAATALRAGELDAVVFVTSQDRVYVRELLLDPDIELVSFVRADAYARRHRYLSAITLPRGVVDLAQDAPASDVRLIAPAAALVTRDGLHPAIQSLLIQAASERFRGGDVLAPPGQFPSPDLVSFPLSREAERYYERGGPSFLRRYLPFWAANLVDRLWVLAIPAATLLYPLVKTAPPVYRWQVQRRIHRWYKDLRRLETEGRAARSEAARTAVRGELARLLSEVGALKVPLKYNDDVYRLRSHIRLVDQIVAELDIADGAATSRSVSAPSPAAAEEDAEREPAPA